MQLTSFPCRPGQESCGLSVETWAKEGNPEMVKSGGKWAHKAESSRKHLQRFSEESEGIPR